MKAFPKDITIRTMKVRHIGVENELGVICPQMTPLEKALNKRGLLHSIGYDGGGREFRTHPISIQSLKQVRGFKYVQEYYGLLKDNTTVLKSGGTHIHISILPTDHENMEANATAMAIAFYSQFQKISGRKSFWARKMESKTLEEVMEDIAWRKVRAGERVYNMKGSMLAPTYHQTLEFRGPMGSNNSEEILAWVEFLNNVVKTCNRKNIEGVQFKQLLKGDRISAYVKSLKGWRKLTEAQLNKKFNPNQLWGVR